MSDTEQKPPEIPGEDALPEPAEQAEETAWNHLAAEEFLKGYAESDAIYDGSDLNVRGQ